MVLFFVQGRTKIKIRLQIKISKITRQILRYHMVPHQDGSFFFCVGAIHVHNIFVQPSEFQHLSHFQSWGNTNNCCCSLG